MIKLVAKAGEKIEVSREHLKQSVLITEMIRNLGIDDEDEVPSDFCIPLRNVTIGVLEMVLKYCKQHHEEWLEEEKNEKPEKTSPVTILSDWDENFLKLDKKVLFDLMMAANYMNIENLLDVTCQAIANLVKGKTTEEMREIFEIHNDLSPEEEAELSKENAWCDH